MSTFLVISYLLFNVASCQDDPEYFAEHCELSIKSESINSFVQQADQKRFVWLHLAFNETIPVYQGKDKLISPFTWSWTFKGQGGAYAFESYGFESNVFSMMLFGKQIGHVNVAFEMAKSCHLEIGEKNSTRIILKSLFNMSSTSNKGRDRSITPVICISHKKGVLSKPLDVLYHMLGITHPYEMQECCEMSENDLDCGTAVSLSNWIPFIISLASVCALYVHLFVTWMLAGNGRGNQDYIFLGESALICTEPESEKQGRRTLHILKKLALWTFFPLHILVCLKILASFYTINKIVETMIENDIPLGDESMPFGLKASSKNTDYFMGGPFIYYSIYFTFGAVLLCIPEDLSRFLYRGIAKRNKSPWQCGFQILHDQLKDHVLMTISVSFWYQTIKRILTWRPRQCSSMFIIVLCPLYICVALSVVIFRFIYHVTSFSKFMVLISKCYLSSIPGNTSRMYKCFLCVIFVIGLIYFSIGSALVYVNTIYFVNAVFFFTFIATMSFPDYSIAYVVMVMAITGYFLVEVFNIKDTYILLVKDTITMCKEVEADNLIILSPQEIPGVRKSLVKYIIRAKYKIQYKLLWAAGKLMLISLVVIMLIYTIQQYNGQKQLSPLVRFVSTILAGLLPKLVQMFSSSRKQNVNEELDKLHIKALVLQFLKEGEMLPRPAFETSDMAFLLST